MADAYIWPTWKVVMEWKAHQHRSVFSCSERVADAAQHAEGGPLDQFR
jgi:hypothetical protein